MIQKRVWTQACLPMNKGAETGTRESICRWTWEEIGQRLELQELPALSWVGTMKVVVQGHSRGQILVGLEWMLSRRMLTLYLKSRDFTKRITHWNFYFREFAQTWYLGALSRNSVIHWAPTVGHSGLHTISAKPNSSSLRERLFFQMRSLWCKSRKGQPKAPVLVRGIASPCIRRELALQNWSCQNNPHNSRKGEAFVLISKMFP